MNRFVLAVLGLVLAAPLRGAATNRLDRPASPPPTARAEDAVEQEYEKLLADDDAAQAEVDRWIQENEAFKARGADYSGVTLNARIRQRFEGVRKAYQDFLRLHPGHTRARLAFGSLLNDLGEDEEALAQWEKARELDPRNPAAWNNLADYYSRLGPVSKAMQYLDRALELNPNEPVYYRNLATVVFLHRKEAMGHYRLPDEQQVLRRALDFYQKARRLDPENFALATDLAQVYYHLQPPKSANPKAAQAEADQWVDEALRAWLDAQRLGRSDLDREGVALHLTRLCLNHGRFDSARKYLAEVQNPALEPMKQRLQRNLERREKGEPLPASEE